MTHLRSALWFPLFDELADPLVVARVASDAEAAGWDGVFVWDQLCWPAPVRNVADPWLTLATIALATEHVRFGPMVTPLPRRRPAKLARETATLDQLGNGRLTLGVGIGSDRFARELSRTGEQVDDRIRGEMLDEALHVLTSAWSGEPVLHRGRHYTVEGVRFLPQPAQRSGVPVWAAGMPGNVKPLRRAARLDGFFPSNLGHPDQLAEVVAARAAARAAASGQALGIDISASMLTQARRPTNLHGPANVRFELGDAQVHPLPAERFTFGISRFGTMFYADPSAGFANIARALRPGAPSTTAEAAAFSLADPAKLHAVLSGAGFVDVQLTEAREPVFYGADGESALRAILSLRMASERLRELDDASADRALGRLRTMLDARDDGGVWFDSSAWLVTARRR